MLEIIAAICALCMYSRQDTKGKGVARWHGGARSVGSVGSGAGEWMGGQLHSMVRGQAVLSHWPIKGEG
jgi:hypothetical protein